MSSKFISFLTQFRRLDVYRKINEVAFDADVVQESQTGAYFSLGTLLVLLYLCLAQTVDYFTPELRSYYRVAKDQPSTVGLFFGVNFSSIPCSAIAVDYTTVYGSTSLSKASNVSAKEFLERVANVAPSVETADELGAKDVHITKKSFVNEKHGLDISASFLDGETNVEPDASWECDSGRLKNPDALFPCINRDVFTTLIFTATSCEPCGQFVTEFRKVVNGGGSSDEDNSPPATTTGAATTTLNHHNSVARAILEVDCEDPSFKTLCTWHSVISVPFLYTYHSGNLVASGISHLPAQNMSYVVDTIVQDHLASPNANCLGWRQTSQCNPLGPREPWRDHKCSSIIPDGNSGYCECVGHTKGNLVSCEHGTDGGGFSCEEVCLSVTSGLDGHTIDTAEELVTQQQLLEKAEQLRKSTEARQEEQQRLLDRIRALKRRHAQMLTVEAQTEQELESLREEAKQLHAQLGDTPNTANQSSEKLQQQLAGVNSKIQQASQKDNVLHADLTAALKEVAKLQRDVNLLQHNETDDETQEKTLAAETSNVRREVDDLRREINSVSNLLKASLRKQQWGQETEGESMLGLLMHHATATELKEQKKFRETIVSPLDVTAAIKEFVGSGCYVSGVAHVDNSPGALSFSVEMPHAFSFPAALIDWTHEWNHFVFTHPKSAASDNRFHRSLLDLEQEASLSMNALGGTKHSSNLAFTSYTHFVELLETHVIANGGEMVDDQKKAYRPRFQYTVTSEKTQSPITGATSLNSPPVVRVVFDSSPLSVTVEHKHKPLYRFITTTCAIVGGVFTVLKVFANIFQAFRS